MTVSQRGLRCEHDDCTETHFRGGLCLTHWREHRRGSPCSIARCGREVHRRDLCRKHYHRWMVWGDPLQIGGRAARIEGQPRTCDIRGCNNPHDSRGWCTKHYTRWRMWGDPNYTARTVAPRAKPRLRRHSTADAATVAQLHNEGLSFSEIGERMGLSKDVVYGMHRRSKVHVQLRDA